MVLAWPSSFSSKTPMEALGCLRVTAGFGIASGRVVSLGLGESTTGWVSGWLGLEVALEKVMSGAFFSSLTAIP